jgi:Family of unknown function (DUF6088)
VVRKPSKNSIATKVRKRVEEGGEDRLWSYPDFHGLPLLAVAAALSRLSKEPDGLLRRVRRGVYYVPKKTRFGESKPELDRVMSHLLKHRGIAYAATGTAAYNGLGLTTQVSPKITYRVNRPVRSVDPGRRFFNVRSVTISPSYEVEGLGSSELAALDAFKDLDRIPDATPAETVGRIMDLIRSGRLSLKSLVRLARHEPPRVRALVGAIGSHLGAAKTVARLKKSLNPLTNFALNVSSVLPNAAEWRIR